MKINLNYSDVNDLKCICCNKKLLPLRSFEYYSRCNKCNIHYNALGFYIYLNGFKNLWHYHISNAGDVSSIHSEISIFNIKECKIFKEVLNRLYKIEIFT